MRDKIIEAMKTLTDDARVNKIAEVLGVSRSLSDIGFIEDIVDEGLSPEDTADVLLEEYDEDADYIDDFDDDDDFEDDDEEDEED